MGNTPALMRALAELAAADRDGRKVLVCPRRGIGRELLRRLALEGHAWVGFEVTTPLALARELVAPTLIERNLRDADEFDELELIDESIDAAVADEGGEVLRPFVEGAGLRAAMANSIRALRLAGLDAATLGRAGFRDRRKREAIERVLSRYERILLGRNRVDPASILRLAHEELRLGTKVLPEAQLLVLPGQERRGWSGALLELLVERGATLLPDDPVLGIEAPKAIVAHPPEADDAVSAAASPLGRLHATNSVSSASPAANLTLFAACSVADEVREVLRRAVAGGLHWDEVEIVASDPIAYGAAIDSLARRLEIPVTYACGLPVRRTRVGRAVDAYLRWIRDDLAEDVLRGALERGDLAPAEGGQGTSGPALSRALRRLSIGRGRSRYLIALERMRSGAVRAVEMDDEDPVEDMEVRLDRHRRTIADLVSVLEQIVTRAPGLPPRIQPEAPVVSPAAIAEGLLAWIGLVPIARSSDRSASPVDATAKALLVARLRRLAAVSLRPTTLDGAISIVAAKIDARVPATSAGGPAPWASTGGFLHVSDIDHGGHTGRRATFVVGLDAMRFPGGAPHDTLLGDEERRRLRTGFTFAPVPTTAERLEERRWQLAQLLARLRGRVTLSYSAWEATEARAVAPAAEMLQAFRLFSRDATADYEAMHAALAVRASAVPRSGGRLDDADVWLGALAEGKVLLRGTDVVRSAFPNLDAGLTAREQRENLPFTAYHGRVEPRAVLDPRNNHDIVLSARRLEMLGTCPLRYFLRYGLRIPPPALSDWAADRWLTPLQRGRLLHDVYERTLREARTRGHDVAGNGFEAIALSVLEWAIEREKEASPPPGDAVLAVETDLLREDVLAFVQMTRSRGAPWQHLEQRFGAGTVREGPVRITLRRGEILVSGAIDRIDATSAGLVVIDYKTGSAESFRRPHAIFHGGRRLQHALYSAVTRRLFGDVIRAEYHFPTHRGETRVSEFAERDLRRARGIIDALLDLVSAGYFHPTDDSADCRFCDYRQVCRVRDETGGVVSPMAEWAKRTDAPELWVMRKLRNPMV